MGRAIVEVAEGEYVWWSSVVDAPVSWIGNRDYITELVRREYGESGVRGLDLAWKNVEEHGHSAPRNWGDSAEEFIKGNRAKGGSGKVAFRQDKPEREATLDEIRAEYAMPESNDEFEADDEAG